MDYQYLVRELLKLELFSYFLWLDKATMSEPYTEIRELDTVTSPFYIHVHIIHYPSALRVMLLLQEWNS